MTLLGLGAMAVAATAYSRLYVFGETLSDVRNLLAAAGIATPPANSGGFDGTFGPGNPVWAEDLAAHLGLSANSSTPGGSNVDVGSLPSNMDGVLPEGFSLPSLAAQIAAAGPTDPNGLYVIQGSNAGAFAGGFSGATVVAGNAGGFSGPTFSSPPSFDQSPLVFGLPPGGQIVCADACPPTEPTLSLTCVENCGPPDLPRTAVCPESECPPQPTNTCVENCTDDPTPGCTRDCGPPTNPTPALTAQVPEPATLVVLTVGMLGLLVLVRQRRRPVRVARE